jgi:glycosyltransferase involved in cell wall biosynthesis
MNNKITVGIPTYKRPKLLSRALNSLVNYDKFGINIIVSVDGMDENYSEYKNIEKKFYSKKINFYYHKKNIGSLNNFLFLRDTCTTKYFMWLADDDEIDVYTIEKLYLSLCRDEKATTIVPYWLLYNDKLKKKLIVPSFFNSDSIFKRVLNYCFNSDDAFFYGLHRLKFLKKCSFKGYWWPNKTSLSNWCYVFQMDLILNGKILFLDDKKFKWINHDYGEKFYPRSSTDKFFKYFAYLIRRINVYFFYLKKIFKNKNYLILIIITLIVPFLLFRDLLFREPAFHKVQFK